MDNAIKKLYNKWLSKGEKAMSLFKKDDQQIAELSFEAGYQISQIAAAKIIGPLEVQIKHSVGQLDAIDGVIPFTEALGKGEVYSTESELDWLVREACRLAALTTPALDAELGLPMDGIAQMLGLDIFDYRAHDVVAAIGKVQELADSRKMLLSSLAKENSELLARLRTAGATAPLPAEQYPDYYTPILLNKASSTMKLVLGLVNLLYKKVPKSKLDNDERNDIVVIAQTVASLAKDADEQEKKLSAAALSSPVSSSVGGSQWVSVADALPEDKSKALFAYGNEVMQGYFMAEDQWQRPNMVVIGGGFNPIAKFSHWQPLPQAPNSQQG